MAGISLPEIEVQADIGRTNRLISALSKSARLQATPENRAALTSTAARLKLNPVDLATVISYESAGSFDPWKKGPTTKWGEHRGLIQFGEPQRKEYGVYQGQSFAEQMPAVEKYLLKSGFKPGMGRKELYSTILAGNPNKSNVSDGYGTANEHLKKMGGHEANAQAFLGGKVDLSNSKSGVLVKSVDDEPTTSVGKVSRTKSTERLDGTNTANVAGATSTENSVDSTSNAFSSSSDADDTPRVARTVSTGNDDDSSDTSEVSIDPSEFGKVRRRTKLEPIQLSAMPRPIQMPKSSFLDDPRLR